MVGKKTFSKGNTLQISLVPSREYGILETKKNISNLIPSEASISVTDKKIFTSEPMLFERVDV